MTVVYPVVSRCVTVVYPEQYHGVGAVPRRPLHHPHYPGTLHRTLHWPDTSSPSAHQCLQWLPWFTRLLLVPKTTSENSSFRTPFLLIKNTKLVVFLVLLMTLSATQNVSNFSKCLSMSQNVSKCQIFTKLSERVSKSGHFLTF